MTRTSAGKWTVAYSAAGGLIMAQLAAVLVLYKQTPEESIALQTLSAGMRGREDLLQLIVYDNSPHSQANLMPPGMKARYFHDPLNGRLFAAYTYALRCAKDESIPWLMLLDQDTRITREYLDEALRLVSERHLAVCAFTPRLIVNGEERSPHPLQPGGVPLSGRSDLRLAAWNSGAILRTGRLLGIGGFPPEFPLDNLDYAVFLMLQQGNERIFVMESRLDHQLSVADVRTLSATRLRGKLESDILLQRRFRQRTRVSLAAEFLRTGLSLLLKLPNKRMGLMCLRYSVACLL